MKKLEVLFVKVVRILGKGNTVKLFARQIVIIDDGNRLSLPVSEGYEVVSITEILTEIDLRTKKDEKVSNQNL